MNLGMMISFFVVVPYVFSRSPLIIVFLILQIISRLEMMLYKS